MSTTKLLSLTFAGAFGLAAVASFATADNAKEAKAPAGATAEITLPPGWTAEDMQACMAAREPGKMHAYLASEAGVWNGKTTMYMPGADPVTSECVSTITPMMDGRFTKCEIKGDMPGMGPFDGFGIYGFDNVSKKFVSSWIDNQGTGMMTGTGELSEDGKVLTWKFAFNCPLTKKPAVMREIETKTSPTTKRFEMFGPDPKTGKEMKMMTIEFTKQS